VDQAAEVLSRLGGEVTRRFYPNMDHSVNQDEIDSVRGMMQKLSVRS
jgi:predicted esterase